MLISIFFICSKGNRVFASEQAFIVVDTIPSTKKDVKEPPEKNTPKKPGSVGKNDVATIKKVPKAKKQPAPKVVRPNVKIKPVKIIKPKITGKGIGR